MAKSTPTTVRILSPEEYPASITARRGAFTPDVKFAAVHPKGIFWVDHEGAGHLGCYFLPNRKGARTQLCGGASSMAGAMRRISKYEDEKFGPKVEREEGKNGPVSIWALGERVGSKKSPTEMDREIERVTGIKL